MADRRRIRPTGVWLLPPALARRLGLWSAWRQRSCPHPGHAGRIISGDERLRGYRWQCMDCGVLSRISRTAWDYLNA